jgi:heterodisulfide reductase subunit C
MSQNGTTTFLRRIEQASGQPVSACFQCAKCSAGCPVARHMDFAPHRLQRMIQYGNRDEILSSAAIWLCVGCETCGRRCPNGISTSKVADALKQEAVREKIRGKEKAVPAMHLAFLAGIRKRGRMHELSLIRTMRLRSGGLFKDLGLGIRMFKKGKLTLRPEKIGDRKGMKRLFERAGRIA